MENMTSEDAFELNEEMSTDIESVNEQWKRKNFDNWEKKNPFGINVVTEDNGVFVIMTCRIAKLLIEQKAFLIYILFKKKN